MNVVRIFTGWGKNFITSNSQWKDAWTYICAALDGTWGVQNNDNGITVVNTGFQSHWYSDVFVASELQYNKVIPVQSFEDYSVLVCNLTTGLIKSCKVSKQTNIFTYELDIGNEYQIFSSEFVLKTKI